MDIKKVNKSLGVSPKICAADLPLIKELGYTLIVCHRPDDEDTDQVNFYEIKQAAEALNIQAIYQPVISGNINDADVATFKKIMTDAKGPVFAYCRTGMRSTTLWSLATAG